MSPRGHTTTGAAAAFAAIWLFAPEAVREGLRAGADLPRMIAELPDGALLFAVGVLFGSRAPDWLEIARWDPLRGERLSVVPHRTLTHWPWTWVAGLVAAWVAGGPWLLAAGFAAGGLLHLLLDWCTPMGIPLGHPFGRRHSLRLYRTGRAGEALAVGAVLAAAGLIVAWA